MTVTIHFTPAKARGTVSAPPSKSHAHRLLIAGALAKGTSVIQNIAPGDDVLATRECLRRLGAEETAVGQQVAVTGFSRDHAPVLPLDCRESASTLRFLLPLCLAWDSPVTLTGSPALMRRPLGVYETLCRERGLLWQQTANSVTVGGVLHGGAFSLPGDVSSQFISGLLFALPLCREDSTLHLKTPVESLPYAEQTVAVLRQFGVSVMWDTPTEITVPGNQTYTPQTLAVEGDYSQSAVLEAFNTVGGAVTVTGLDPASAQGDKVYREAFARLVAGKPTIAVENCPDCAPIFMVVGALHHGVVLTGTHRLALKESSRGECMKRELEKCGVRVTAEENRLTVTPGNLHAPAVPLQGHHDHRIVMALAVLLSALGGTLTEAEAVAKSYPDFWETLNALHLDFSEE